MTFSRLRRPIIAAAILSCSGILMPAAALAAPATSAGPVRASAAAAAQQCTGGNTVVWLGLPGSGAAGSIFYQLEFSNVGRRTCWLYGYPGVSAINGNGSRVGPAASHSGRRRLVTLSPGATGHAVLQIVEAGNIAGCHIKTAAGLKVYAPGQRRANIIGGFSFQACSNKRVLSVGPVRPGTGIPGFSS
jgi:hypothetical protein